MSVRRTLRLKVVQIARLLPAALLQCPAGVHLPPTLYFTTRVDAVALFLPRETPGKYHEESRQRNGTKRTLTTFVLQRFKFKKNTFFCKNSG